MLRTRPTALLFKENFLKVDLLALPPLLQRPPPLHITVRKPCGAGLPAKGAAENLLKLTVSCQNCNSLNLTTNMQSYDIKIVALKSLNTDVILLCDTRLVNNKGVKGAQRLKNSCRDARGRSYDVFVNSNSNSRGVAILVATELSLTAIYTHIDPEENFIFMHTHYLGHDLLLGAIYGPNSTSRDFNRRMSHIISQYSHCKIKIGGDWNTMWDSAPLNNNIDVYKMAALLNPKNSELLKIITLQIPLECYTLLSTAILIPPLAQHEKIGPDLIFS